MPVCVTWGHWIPLLICIGGVVLCVRMTATRCGGVADAVGSFGNISLFTYVNPNTGALDGTWYNSYQVTKDVIQQFKEWQILPGRRVA